MSQSGTIYLAIDGKVYEKKALTLINDYMVVKFIKISSKSTMEAVREKGTHTFSKKYRVAQKL